jgi:hypothetical protein
MIRVAFMFAASLQIVSAADAYAGSAACAGCHRDQFTAQSRTSMARALERAADCEILWSHPALKFQEGMYTTSIMREGEKSFYQVTDGSQAIRVQIEWAFGLGVAGQTYVIQHNGEWYESRTSFYNEVGGLALTMGASGYRPKTIEEALGRRMSARDGHDCFACHSTGGSEALQIRFEAMTPGVQCENCHGPAASHVQAMKTGDAKRAVPPKLAKLTSEEMSDACGRCHRTWSQIALEGPHDIRNIRFQPYRLVSSKCYDSADARISCAACHDPHRNVETRASAYDAKCLACHSVPARQQGRAAKVCKRGTENCSSCHMPKLDLPGAHHQFTDHNIRIVRTNEPYPG